MAQRAKKANFYKKEVVVKSNSVRKRLAITSGEGVGFFIVHSALKKIGPAKNFQFVVWSDKNSPTLKIPKFKTLVFKNEVPAFKSEFRENHLLQIKKSGGAGSCLQKAGEHALRGEVSALITGPVNKSSLKKYWAVGQTDLLKKLSHARYGFMCFRGACFNVILLTDHCALKQITLKTKSLKALLDLALSARQFLPKRQQKKPLGILGLNPHAGEQGLLGSEEEKILKPLLRNTKEVEGPLSPDGAFLKKFGENTVFLSLFIMIKGLFLLK